MVTLAGNCHGLGVLASFHSKGPFWGGGSLEKTHMFLPVLLAAPCVLSVSCFSLWFLNSGNFS